MRLKEDSSSYHSSAIVKRDYRHDHSQPSDEITIHKKKDTRKWCRGKYGILHQYERFFLGNKWHFGTMLNKYIYLKCVECGKTAYPKKNDVHLPLHIGVNIDYSGYRVPVRLSDGSYSGIVRDDNYCESCREYHG